MPKTTIQLIVPDINCLHCSATIIQGLKTQDGIEHVAVDVPTKMVTVEYHPDVTNEVVIKDMLEALGYLVSEIAKPLA